MSSTPNMQEQLSRLGRCVALYPGAFRPPHAAHVAVVHYLLSQPGIDEVVVIISNRCRPIPGTTKALDANVVKTIWSLYLEEMAKVRVEIADHAAVQHALAYFDRLKGGDTLLLCMGETDLEGGDDRFAAMEERSKQTGVSAKILAAPTASLTVRGKALRQALALGDAGRKEFLGGLPPSLSPGQKEQVWQLCRQGLRDIGVVLQEKVEILLSRQGVGNIDQVVPVKSGKMDQVFRIHCSDGRYLYVKYAGDTAEAGRVGDPLHLKPRKRVAAERRMLNCLHVHKIDDVELPEVVLFDKATLLLVLSEVCPGGTSLHDELQAGRFEPSVAATAGRFLAGCHAIPEPIAPLWGNMDRDVRQWKRMLDLRTVEIPMAGWSDQVRQQLRALHRESDQAKEHGVFHLDLCPKNILVGKGRIGVIDCELSSSVGDPAYDLGMLLGHYLLWGLLTSSGDSCYQALQAVLQAYQEERGLLDVKQGGRVAAFAGATILYELWNSRVNGVRGQEQHVANLAERLLLRGLEAHETIDRIISAQILK